MQSFAGQYSITQSTIIRVKEMNLSLEAYDWWATKIPTQYRTLDSYSKSFNGFVHINDENGENLFDAYLKVWVSHFYHSSDRAVCLPCVFVVMRVHVHQTLILITVSETHLNPKRKNVMEFIRRL